MDFAQAKEELSFHCGSNPQIEDPRWKTGFLSSLRPFRGLDRGAMRKVDVCVDAVQEHLKSAESLDREVINSLWGIVHFGRAWALEADSMLKRNNLISNEEAAELETWLNELSYRVAMWLDGNVQE